MVLLVSGYLAMVEQEKESIKPLMTHHLQEVLADAKLYGWELVRAYCDVWLQQVEND